MIVTVMLLLLGGAVLFAWRSGWLEREEAHVEVSEAAAVSAETKIRAFHEDGRTARLSGVELSSLLRYRSPQWVTNMVAEPTIVMEGDSLRLTGRVATDQLPSHPELDAARAFLPDSSEVEVTGRIASLPSGRVAMQVTGVEVAGLPVPRRYFPRILERVGRREEAGLAENAVAIRLPGSVRSARIDRGVLILTP